MLYAQFYQLSTGYIVGTIPPKFGKPEIIEACGDRSVIILDGRYTETNNILIARSECIKRGYIGYSVHDGRDFNNENSLTVLSFRQV